MKEKPFVHKTIQRLIVSIIIYFNLRFYSIITSVLKMPKLLSLVWNEKEKKPTELLSMFIFIILVIMNFTSQQHIMQNKNNWVEAKLFRRSHRQLSHRRAFRDRGTSVMKKGQKSLFFLLFFKQLLEMMKAFAHYNETENVNHTLGCNSFSFTEDFHYFSSFYNTNKKFI